MDTSIPTGFHSYDPERGVVANAVPMRTIIGDFIRYHFQRLMKIEKAPTIGRPAV